MQCRTSQEVRGLKYTINGYDESWHRSHLARGAWIEIFIYVLAADINDGRTSQEVRGLK